MATQYRALGKCRFLMSALKGASTTTTTATAATTKSAAAKAAGAKPLKGIVKPVQISKTLQDFIGANEASRTEAVKKVWEHIKLNNLQNPRNKREIICDQKLKTLFSGKDTVGFLDIARLLSEHFVKKAA